MGKLQIKESTLSDVQANIIEDIAPEMMIKVFPYELINSDEQIAFIQNNTVTVASISQRSFEVNKEFHDLTDEQGVKYFNAIAAITSSQVLDLKSSTSAFGLVLKQENEFQIVTNQFYDHQKFKPMVATFNKPFDRHEFEAGRQEVYFIGRAVSAKGNRYQEHLENIKSEDELVEISFANVSQLESTAKNARILFTPNEKFSEGVATFDGNKGISLKIEAHTLLHSIKGKGKTSRIDTNGNPIPNSTSEFGEINFLSKEKWAPFKFIPTSIRDKTSMYADWFDYDTVLPFVHINKFKAGAPLSAVITNKKDLEMIEDMLTISAGYASSWDTAPVITSGSETGKIKPDFRVGHAGIKISAIVNVDPIKVTNSIYDNHIRKEPEFETTPERYQPAKAVINALSRYIYSKLAIGQGENSYNQAYLPWYLEPYFDTPILFEKSIDITNPDKGGTGQVKTYIINDGVKFQAKTTYFHKNFSADVTSKGNKELELPDQINFSNHKLLQTDRKLTLPEVPETIIEMNKLPLPGDIKTDSSEALKYIWYLPVQVQTLFEEFMLNTLTAHTGPPVGRVEDVQLPRTPGGTTWNQLQANNAILALYPGGKITTATILSQEEEVYSTHTYSWEGNRNGTRIFKDGVMISEYDQRRTDAQIIADDIGVPVSGLVLTGGTGSATGTYIVKLKYTRFSLAQVEIISQAGTSFSYTNRQILFDKQEWKEFLARFRFVPNSHIPYSFDERKGWKIEKLNELIITSIWGNDIIIYFGTGPHDFVKIPMLNKDDETIATQRILFV